MPSKKCTKKFGEHTARKDQEDIKARRIVTERCLIAADVDRTILEQTTEEKDAFRLKVAPALVQSAQLGINIAFLSGNSMKQVTSRILKLLLGELIYTNHLQLIQKFHFFSNSGGVYSHFSLKHDDLNQLCNKDAENLSVDEVLDVLTEENNGEIVIKPKFIRPNYVERCTIREKEIPEIESVLKGATKKYLDDINKNKAKYKQIYDLNAFDNKQPYVDMRWIRHTENADQNVSVQITLRPVLSFRHAVKTRIKSVFGRDLRAKLIAWIQKELDKRGLGHYVARPGGRSSIDITREKLDKAYALEYLIDHLNAQGTQRKGKKLGSNTIYLGDEVIVGGGNDYPVTRIPGLLVMAVNPDKELVPFSSNIFVPHELLEGPDATHDVLTRFNRMAKSQLSILKSKSHMSTELTEKHSMNAVEAFKIDMFNSRIVKKIQHLTVSSADELQTIHAFVTLMCRKDSGARTWITLLVNELNEIMAGLSEQASPMQAALGTSYDESLFK